MTAQEKSIIEAVLQLPPPGRRKIIRQLNEYLETTSALDEAIDQAEVDWKAYKDGKIKGIPVEEVFPGLKKKKGKRRGSSSSS